MSSTEISCRYARALFAMAERETKVEKWQMVLNEIASLFEEERRFLSLCLSPQLEQKLKIQLIERTFANLVEQPLIDFLLLLLKKRRLQLFPEICLAFERLADVKLGRLAIRLITALPLDEQAEKRLQESLESKFHQKIYIKREIDPSLLAGGMLMIGNKRVDATLQGKLLRLKKYLLKREAA